MLTRYSGVDPCEEAHTYVPGRLVALVPVLSTWTPKVVHSAFPHWRGPAYSILIFILQEQLRTEPTHVRRTVIYCQCLRALLCPRLDRGSSSFQQRAEQGLCPAGRVGKLSLWQLMDSEPAIICLFVDMCLVPTLVCLQEHSRGTSIIIIKL